MPSVTITLTDTPDGGVCVHSNFVPAVGKHTSTAQVAALDIINRTCREYGLPNPLKTVTMALRDGVDIDAVHRTRDRVVHTTGHVDVLPASESGDRRFWPIEAGK